MKKLKLHILLPLLFCLIICIFYRSADTNINILLEMVLEDRFLTTKSSLQAVFPMHNFFIYILPAALWMFSVTLLADGLKIAIGKFQFPLIHIPILYLIALELLQMANISNGRFDIMDIIFPIIAWMIACVIIILKQEYRSSSPLRYLLFFVVLCSVYMADTHFSF